MTKDQKGMVSGDDSGVHAVLGFYDFYSRAPESFQQKMREVAVYIEVERGHPIMQSGAACAGVLFVGSGRVRIFVEGERGRTANLYHVHSGECCPINIGASLLKTDAVASAVADSALKAVAVPAESFDMLRGESSELRDWLFDATASRYGEIVSLLRNVITLTVDQRLAAYLLKNVLEDDEGGALVRKTHADLAMDIGTAREVVNRRLKVLQNADIVALGRGAIRIVDQAALTSIRDEGTSRVA
jgi:CRP/FNR family transcriptional regulator